ncbi:hypothetical protein ACJX0J_039510, partial [Zea mays]
YSINPINVNVNKMHLFVFLMNLLLKGRLFDTHIIQHCTFIFVRGDFGLDLFESQCSMFTNLLILIIAKIRKCIFGVSIRYLNRRIKLHTNSSAGIPHACHS